MRPAGALLVLAVAGLTLVPARPAAAAEFVVTLPGDPAPGPACLAGGDCSLREAVLAANATAGPDLVRLPAGTFALSRVGAGEDAAATGDLDVTDDLILAGAGSADTIVDGGALGDRILDVRGTSVRLEGLTITGGGRLAGGGIVSRGGNVLVDGAGASLGAEDAVVRGGAAEYGGGVAVAGAADQAVGLTDTVIDGNAALIDGGGLFADAGGLTVTVTGGALTANTAGRDGGGAWVQGPHTLTADGWEVSANRSDRAGGLGLLGAGSTATLTGVTVRGNDATDAANGYGAGIWANGTRVELAGSLVEENTAARTGGGVYVRDAQASITDTALSANAAAEAGGGFASETSLAVLLERVLVDDNQAADGGGVFAAVGPVTLRNATVSGNLATTGAGGVAMSGTGDLVLEYATVAGNSSDAGTAGNLGVARTATLTGSVVAAPGTGDENCVLAAGATTAATGSVEDADTCGLDPASNRVGVDALLGPLRGNGGPTRTRAPAAASPAIDLAGPDCPETDQRGEPRPTDGDGDGDAVCDAGAYEVQPVADLAVTLADGPDPVRVGSPLTYVVAVVNNGPQAAAAVTVTDTLAPTVTLTEAGGPGVCDAEGQVVTCALGPLAAGAEATVEITVTPQEPGSVENTASAASSVPDPTPENATATTTTTVLAPGEPPPEPPPGEGPDVIRLAGPGRVETALEVSRARFDQGQAAAVVLARADLFPDSLAGTPLAVRLGAPLLLTGSDALHPLVEAELARVLAPDGTVYLLGGTVALSQAVADRLGALGYASRRFGGADRFATAVVVATEGIGDPATVFVADGGGFPDALAAGTAAGVTGGAVVLSAGQVMPDATRAYLDGGAAGTTRYAVGGPAAAAAPEATPLVGATRIETALAVARSFFPAPPAVGIATGTGFPDALAGGAHVGRLGGPILLSQPDALPAAVGDYLADVAEGVSVAYLYGGEQVLAAEVEQAVGAALGAPAGP